MTLGTDKVLKDESHGSSLHGINQSLLNELSVVEIITVGAEPLQPAGRRSRFKVIQDNIIIG